MLSHILNSFDYPWPCQVLKYRKNPMNKDTFFSLEAYSCNNWEIFAALWYKPYLITPYFFFVYLILYRPPDLPTYAFTLNDSFIITHTQSCVIFFFICKGLEIKSANKRARTYLKWDFLKIDYMIVFTPGKTNPRFRLWLNSIYLSYTL